MGSIFSLSNHKYIYLYPQNQSILFRSSSYDSFSHPVSLCQDYLSDDTEIIFQGTIYYCYISVERQLIIKNISVSEPVYRSDFTGKHPKLLTINARLAVIFWEKDDTDVINILYPLEQGSIQKMHRQTPVHSEPALDTSLIEEAYKKQLLEKDALIESIKQQYNELMDTASKYRAEALKWRSKFLG